MRFLGFEGDVISSQATEIESQTKSCGLKAEGNSSRADAFRISISVNVNNYFFVIDE